MKIGKFKIKLQNSNESPMKSAFAGFTAPWKAAEKRKSHEDPYDLVISFREFLGSQKYLAQSVFESS